MNCEEVRDNLPAWMDEELDDLMTQNINAHVDQCPNCAREADTMRRLSALLQKSSDEDPPAGFRSRLLANLLQEEKEKQPLYTTSGMSLSWTIGIVTRGTGLLDSSTPVLNYSEYAHKPEPVESEPETIRYLIPPYLDLGG